MTRRGPRAPTVEPTPHTGVGFGTPPAFERGKYDWEAIAERCRSNPGEWLLVFEQDRRSIATAARQGSVRILSEANGFEVTTRNNKPDADPPVCDLWVRWLDPNSKKKAGAR